MLVKEQLLTIITECNFDIPGKISHNLDHSIPLIQPNFHDPLVTKFISDPLCLQLRLARIIMITCIITCISVMLIFYQAGDRVYVCGSLTGTFAVSVCFV